MKYRITFRKPQDIQFNCETLDGAEAMAARITEVIAMGYQIENVDQFEATQDPANVRFDYETGARIQYEDADDASEHHLHMMGG